MIIAAKDLIQNTIPTVSYLNTVGEAISLMKDSELHQLVVVNEGMAEGILYLEDVEHEPEETALSLDMLRDKGVGINGDMHATEAIKLLSSNDWEVIPVLDENMKFVGCIKWDYALSTLNHMMAINLPGSIIVLRRLAVDYSMAEIARICESNDCRIISSGIMPEEGSHAVIVTIKVDKQELGPLVSAFYRYEYEVIASFGDDEYKDFLKGRFDLLMNYLNM